MQDKITAIHCISSDVTDASFIIGDSNVQVKDLQECIP